MGFIVANMLIVLLEIVPATSPIDYDTARAIIGPAMAKKFGVKLVMYGENQAEYGNAIEENKNPIVYPNWQVFNSQLIAQNPKVSIVIPTLNRYDYFRHRQMLQKIRKFFAQDYAIEGDKSSLSK